ncbi:MAG: anti-sigma regulatory factor [Pseudomonadota bacterium]
MVGEVKEGQVGIASESDLIPVRQVVRHESTVLGFSPTDVTRIVTAASELARNIFRYAGAGAMRWSVSGDAGRTCFILVFEDHGPGIADVEAALLPGFTTAGGLGLGLPGAKRLMDEMQIQSEVGRGTTVTIKKWLRK